MIKKLLIGTAICLLFGIFLIFRPTKNQKVYGLEYSNIPAKNFSYIRKNTGAELQKAVKDADSSQDVEKTKAVGNSAVTKEGVEGAIQFCESKLGCPYSQDAQDGNRIFTEEAREHAYQEASSRGRNSSDLSQYVGMEMYDCSFLMQKAYEAVGYKIGRDTYSQVSNGQYIDPSDKTQWKRGDLIFPTAGHVAMYLGDNKIIHAPKWGDEVKEAEIYWHGAAYAVRRIVK